VFQASWERGTPDGANCAILCLLVRIWLESGLMGEVGRDAGGVRTAVVFVGIDRFMVGERWMKKRVSQ